MIGSPRPQRWACGAVSARHPASRGFSLVELLVTIVLAGIIFAAMVPLFVSALKKTGGDNSRVTAMYIAQDRIEKIRQLPYSQISADPANQTSSPNLYNQSSFGTATPRPFATTYTAVGSSKTYIITYGVIPHSNYKDVTVTVTWGGWGPNYTTRMKTVIMDPTAASATSTANPYPPLTGTVTGVIVRAGGSNYTSAPTVVFSGGGGTGAAATAIINPTTHVVTGVSVTSPGSGYTSPPTVSFTGGGGSGATAVALEGYTLTVAFKDATQVISPGVKVTYTDATGTHTPAPMVPETFPFPSKTYQLTWTGLPGGVLIPYTVTCTSSYITSTAPVFHLLTTGWIKFDTHPGGS